MVGKCGRAACRARLTFARTYRPSDPPPKILQCDKRFNLTPLPADFSGCITILFCISWSDHAIVLSMISSSSCAVCEIYRSGSRHSEVGSETPYRYTLSRYLQENKTHQYNNVRLIFSHFSHFRPHQQSRGKPSRPFHLVYLPRPLGINV